MINLKPKIDYYIEDARQLTFAESLYLVVADCVEYLDKTKKEDILYKKEMQTIQEQIFSYITYRKNPNDNSISIKIPEEDMGEITFEVVIIPSIKQDGIEIFYYDLRSNAAKDFYRTKWSIDNLNDAEIIQYPSDKELKCYMSQEIAMEM